MDFAILGTVMGALVLGGIAGVYLRKAIGARKVAEAEGKAQQILEEAQLQSKTLKKEAELEVRDKQIKAKADFERDLEEKRKTLHSLEKKLEDKEENLERKFNLLENKEDEMYKEEKELQDRRDQIKVLENQYQEKLKETQRALELAAGFTSEEAKKQLKQALLDETKQEAATMMMKVEEEAKEEADKRAKYIIASTIERVASDYVSERSLSVVPLPNEELKGRIIGREGRNIRAFEAATGIDVVIDDTPEAVVLSGFNPVRREVARMAMERLLQDGRIHPSRIEETVAKAQEEVDQTIIKAGEEAFVELKIPKAHPELIKMVGALKYRFSYAQNVLRHSIEVGFICGMMAAELGLDEMEARRAGLLHDCGKAVTHEIEGAHALIGMDFCKRYKESDAVCHAVGAHHEDLPQIYALDCLVDAADALSGARPGARREVLESYMKRLEDLEKISLSFNGVEKAYAVQAGREIRVMVNFQEVTDSQAFVISKDIAKKIESEMTYPGQIKVTVIRETRATEYAK